MVCNGRKQFIKHVSGHPNGLTMNQLSQQTKEANSKHTDLGKLSDKPTKQTKPADEEFYAYDAGLGVKWPANKFVCVPGAPMKFLPVRPLKPAIKMAELFSGTARLSASFACLGVEAWAWDILYGPGGDLTSGRVLKDLKERIRKKEFTVVTFALQCSSWSRARKNDGKGPPPLRDDEEFLFGLPNLSEKDQKKVDDANQMLDTMLQVLEICLQAGAMVVSFYLVT